ncbi:MAG TPA: GNAT family N-acetyltransferase [Kofleriaceae bacterium]
MTFPGRFALRAATLDDVAAIVPRSSSLQAHEGIEISDAALEGALREMLVDPSLGGVWMIEDAGAIVGYAFISLSFDLEFAGREAWLTELFIDDAARGRGAGTFALDALASVLRGLGVHAMHLQVRADNPALRLYERAGFTKVPRLIMSRRL